MKKNTVFFLVLVASLISIYLQLYERHKSSRTAEKPVPAEEAISAKIPSDIERKKPIDSLAEFDLQQSKQITDIAKLLAGIQVQKNPEISVLQESPNWVSYAEFMNSAWSKLETKQLTIARQWSASELKQVNATKSNIFYPFSGPDFLYANTFFEGAPKYILAGLEPVGSIPKISNLTQATQQMQGVQQSLYTLLQYSFFRTIDMRSDLKDNGVLPLLYVFLARNNNTLLEVKYIGLNKKGQLLGLHQPPQEGSGLVPGVKISFLSLGETQPQTLYYFAVDLSDAELQKTPEFLKFISEQNLNVTYLKAASYLMHRDTFSNIRNFILNRSKYVLQDDSGIPVRYFEEAKWTRQFYGSYIKPIDLFAVRYQPDLRQIYQNNPNIKSLGFGIGYKFDRDANLMLAISKDKGTN
jgi:hypothetical protein